MKWCSVAWKGEGTPRAKIMLRRHIRAIELVQCTCPGRSLGVAISGPISKEFAQILSPEALDFVAKLHRKFESRRQELLARRAERQKQFDAGAKPDFLAETKSIRESDWQVAEQPKDTRSPGWKSPARPIARW